MRRLREILRAIQKWRELRANRAVIERAKADAAAWQEVDKMRSGRE